MRLTMREHGGKSVGGVSFVDCACTSRRANANRMSETPVEPELLDAPGVIIVMGDIAPGPAALGFFGVATAADVLCNAACPNGL